MGLVWDPIALQVVVYPNYGNVIYMLDPATWTCTSETYGSTQGTDYPQNTDAGYGGQGINSGDEGTFGHFQYSAANDVFLLCNNWKSDCWYLRRNR